MGVRHQRGSHGPGHPHRSEVQGQGAGPLHLASSRRRVLFSAQVLSPQCGGRGELAEGHETSEGKKRKAPPESQGTPFPSSALSSALQKHAVPFPFRGGVHFTSSEGTPAVPSPGRNARSALLLNVRAGAADGGAFGRRFNEFSVLGVVGASSTPQPRCPQPGPCSLENNSSFLRLTSVGGSWGECPGVGRGRRSC